MAEINYAKSINWMLEWQRSLKFELIVIIIKDENRINNKIKTLRI